MYKCITVIDYAVKFLLILSGWNSHVSLFSFTAVIGTPVLVLVLVQGFLSLMGLSKCLWKQWKGKR